MSISTWHILTQEHPEADTRQRSGHFEITALQGFYAKNITKASHNKEVGRQESILGSHVPHTGCPSIPSIITSENKEHDREDTF